MANKTGFLSPIVRHFFALFSDRKAMWRTNKGFYVDLFAIFLSFLVIEKQCGEQIGAFM